MHKKNFIIGGITIIAIVIVTVIVGWNKKTANAPVAPSTATSTTLTASTSTSAVASVSAAASSSNSTSSMTVALQGVYKGKSFSFNYPASWAIFSLAPFSIDTFGGKYENGGVIPAGGAEIDIVTTTASGLVQDIIDTELMYAKNLTASTVSVDGVSCKKEVYEADYAPSASSKDVALYCSRGSELWKIYLSYGASDSAEQTHLSDLNGILSSMKLL